MTDTRDVRALAERAQAMRWATLKLATHLHAGAMHCHCEQCIAARFLIAADTRATEAERLAVELMHPNSTLARCCSWCEQPYTHVTTLRPTVGDKERIKADAQQHFLTCSAHPAVAAKEQAEQQLAEARAERDQCYQTLATVSENYKRADAYLREKIATLTAALEALMAVQNDAPLEKYRREWEAAMVQAAAALYDAALTGEPEAGQ